MEVAEVAEVSVKRYHGCSRVNRNGTHKLIDYRRGERCICPTNNRCQKEAKVKYLVRRPYLTRRSVKLLKLKKEIHIVAGFEEYQKGDFYIITKYQSKMGWVLKLKNLIWKCLLMEQFQESVDIVVNVF